MDPTSFTFQPSNTLGNVLSQLDLVKACTSRSQAQKYQPVYSNEVTPTLDVTSQKSSGRCWMFAGLNVIRHKMIQKYGLGNDFAFSQSYVFFWDKMERTNYFLDNIWQTRHQPVDGRLVTHLLKDPYCDGGQWDMFVNLVEKHGLVPKEYYQESHNSSNSRRLNWLLTCRARQVAQQVREQSDEQFKATKESFLQETYFILCNMLGEPPKEFTWEYRSKKGEFRTISKMSPQSFYHEMVPFKTKDYVCLVHDPRNDYGKAYTVKYLGNVVGGRDVRYLNAPTHALRSSAIEMLKDNEPVWFGCDVGKWCSRTQCSMDLDLVDYTGTLGVEFSQSKADRLRYGESLMTHAMVFTGVHIVDGKPVRWKVENSWGSHGPNKGYYNMSDDWFEQYNYEVVVPLSRLSEDMQATYRNKEVVAMEPWDPLGALA
jgi:bleomycin hydrolase